MGAGAPGPVDPSHDLAAVRALAAYERHLADVDAAPWRFGIEDRAEAERAAATAAGRDVATWALTPAERSELARLVPDVDERAALALDAARFRRGLEGPVPSLDTWEHLDTSNSGDDPPARPRKTPTVPPGHDERDRERIIRYDRAKAGLVPAIYAAADALRDQGPEHYGRDPDAPFAGPAILARMAWRVSACRDVRAFRDAGCGAVHARKMSCDVRLCPDCERSRSGAYAARLAGIAATMTRPIFETFTIPNVPAGLLGLGVDVIGDAFAALRRTALFAGGPCRNAHPDPDDRPDKAGQLAPRLARCRHAPHRAPASRACRFCGRRLAAHAKLGCTFEPKDCACARCMRSGAGCRRCIHAPTAGGVAALEVTLGAAGDWHPHMHVVADAGGFIRWRELRDAWRAASCDATRRAVARGADTGRAAGYTRPTKRPRVELPRCRHLADQSGRPADLVCSRGHGWRERDGDHCPYQDRAMDGPCSHVGEPVPDQDRCRGASIVWVQKVKGKPGQPAGAAAVREAIKYATKGLLDADGNIVPAVRERPELLAELLLVLRNRRMVQGWGSFHGATDDPEDADDPDLVSVDVGELFPARLPRLCPACQAPALWDYLGTRRRADCLPGPAGRLVWRPPPPPGGLN